MREKKNKLIFSEAANEYKISADVLDSPEELNRGLYLVLAGIDDIPPHIALINDGKYYSVSTRKVEVGEPIDKFLKAISRRTVPTVFIHTKPPLQGEYRGAEGPGDIFEHYHPLGNGEHSCLWPVRDFFADTFSPEFVNCSLVFELLALAQKQNLLMGCKAIFTDIPVPGMLTLPKYTHEQIREKINSLLKVNE